MSEPLILNLIPDVPSELLVPNESEYQRIVHDWNDTRRDFPKDQTLLTLFAERVALAPQQIAIVYRDQKLSYQVLDECSTKLARFIQKYYQQNQLPLTPDTLIALSMNRTFELFIGLLAILKTGAAYVPIEPKSPIARVRHVLQETSCRLLLTQSHLLDELRAFSIESTLLLSVDEVPYQNESAQSLAIEVSPTSLAYVMYTSGTTGLPKGVMITHRNVVSYWANVTQYFDDVTNVDFSSSIAFDLSVTTTIIPLLCGKTIVIYPGRLQDVEEYIEHLQHKDIHFIKSTPSYLSEAFSLPQQTWVKKCFVGGEKLNYAQLQRILTHVDLLFDEYGPTENTIGTTLIQKTLASRDIASIGRPYANHKVYVLDDKRQPVPVGVAGELYVGGAGLARGYLEQPALTAIRFIANPFATELDVSEGYTHIYQTGDRVRWLSDGQLEFIGRCDFQVKIRGFRIELGDIEHALLRYEAIQQALVIHYQQGVQHHNLLVAYYQSEQPLDEQVIINALKLWLPEYMLPDALVHLKKFPLTINGKIDRESLQKQATNINAAPYIAPVTDLEQRLCSLWKEVLGVARVGTADDFFKLGGDSIQSIQLIAGLLREGIHCRVRDLITHRTVGQLSLILGASRHIQREQGLLVGEVGLLPVQAWFFAEQFPQISHWNQSFLVRVPPLSLERLHAALHALVDHHDMLRVCFPKKANGLRCQTFGAKNMHLTIQTMDIGGFEAPVTETLSAWQQAFDIEQGPLWQMGYLTGYSDGSARLYFAAHHLIIDTVSWRILIDDMKRLYQGDSLGEKSSSYRQWVQLIHQYPNMYPEEFSLWIDDNAPHPQISLSTKGYASSFKLSKDVTKQLLGASHQAYHTEINDLLLTALGRTLSSFFGGSSHRIMLEGHGREELDDSLDLSRTLGWFTALYPVTLSVEEDIAKNIKTIKEHLRSIPNKGVGYGAFKYQDGLGKTSQDLPQITFNYLGQFDSATGFWQLVLESSGQTVHPKNQRPHVLEITALVVEGVFHVELSSYISKQAAHEIACLLEAELLSITAHCLNEVAQGRGWFTPSDVKLVNISVAHLWQLQQQDQAIIAIHAANSLQQGFIYHALRNPEDEAYRVQMLVDYYHTLDREAYQRAWQLAIATFPILRTYFNWDEALIQIATRVGRLEFQCHDLLSVLDKEQALLDIAAHDRKTPFILTQPTLMRLHLIQYDTDHVVLLQTTHHSILDGLSSAILLGAVHRFYDALLHGKTPSVVVDHTYLVAQDYIAEHRALANTFWQTTLKGVEINDLSAMLSVPTLLNERMNLEDPRQLVWSETLDDYQAMKLWVKEIGVTLNIVLQFAWHKLIQIYTGDSQTVVGTTISGRTIPVPSIDQSVGLHINTLPLILTWEASHTVLDQLQSIASSLALISEYGCADLALLQREGERLFHSLFIAEIEDVTSYTQDATTGLHYQNRGTIETLDYPLVLVVKEFKEHLALTLKYDGTLLTDEKAQDILRHLSRILHQLPDKMHAPHNELSIFSKEDYQTIIYDWNDTEEPFAHEKMIQVLFEEQVLKTPEKLALVFQQQEMTYQVLNTRANQLAHFLQECYQHLSMIGLFFESSFEMVIALLAILKLGKAYVPIDPSWPKGRIKAIFDQMDCWLVLASSHLIDEISAFSSEKTQVLAVTEALYQLERVENLACKGLASDLAYVIYTSGTTGRPKGVMITHQNVGNYLGSILKNDAFLKTSRIDCSTSIAFDATIAVLLGPLVSGRCVVLCPEEVKRDVKLYVDHLKQYRIDLIRLTPSYLAACLRVYEQAQLRALLSSVRVLMVGGEKAQVRDIRTWMILVPNSSVINHYGPTETTVACGIYTIKSLEELTNLENIPIGKASHNHQFYVLDKFLKPVPIGVTGELYVGGAGVAQGYFNQPKLTKEYFIANPYVSEKNKEKGYRCFYKTGDLVRFLPDGHLEFIGRNDFQVKIRGFRVELSEIEQVILALAHVQQCVVVIVEKERALGVDQQLVAYLMSEVPLESSIVKNHVEHHLPNYMVPNVFIQIDTLPLTTNGKLDRQALPKPLWIDEKSAYVGPRNAVEVLLCDIWQTVLNIQRIGIHDDFFSLGGHSILAIHLTHRMSQVLHQQVLVVDIFKHRTIAHLCQALSKGERLAEIVKSEGCLAPLSYAADRLWFIEQYEQGTDAYHIPLLFELEVTLNEDVLQEALQAMVRRHAVLRTIFVQSEQGEYLQEIKDAPLRIVQQRVDRASFQRVAEAFVHQPFDLMIAYPVRAALWRMKNSHVRYLMMVFHHVAFDAWSKDIFVSELSQLYQGYLDGVEPQLTALTIQYQDFAIWQRQVVEERKEALCAFWHNTLKDHELLAFPTDYPRPLTLDYRGEGLEINVSKMVLDELKDCAEKQGVTLFSVLLTVFAVVLSTYSGQEDVIIGAPITNRQHPQLAGVIGFFVNLLPLKITVTPTMTFAQCLKATHQYVFEAQEKDLPFAALVEHLAPIRDESRHPLFQILFNVEYQSKAPVLTDALKLISFKINEQPSKMDLSVSIHEMMDSLLVRVQYRTSLFKSSTIKRFANHFERILENFVAWQDVTIGTYPLLSKDEYQQIVVDWNRTDKDFPRNKTIHQLFEEQVLRTPEKVAVVFENEHLTYQELNQKANQLARLIKKRLEARRGLQETSQPLMVICLERRALMIVSMLGILKAGGAYVPLLPETPLDRISHVLNDTKSVVLLTEPHLVEKLAVFCPSYTEILLLDDVDHEETHDLNQAVSANDLAYVIYTSGTTGLPKGVLIEHRGVINMVSHIRECLGLGANSHVLQFASLAFDASALQIFNTLTIGATLFILPEEMRRDAHALGTFLKMHSITYAAIPPALLAHLDPYSFPALETVVLAGEASQRTLMERWCHGRRLINAYGPTENTIGAAVHRFISGDEITNIGRPLPNVKAYVLDKALRPVPIGVVGELYLAGVGVARGYLNQAELTKERFIANPFAEASDKTHGYTRLYKTGDLVRFLPDGQLLFMGRNDFQVKIRGFRVELSEIEQVILRHDAISQCGVLVVEKESIHGMEQHLVAYIVTRKARYSTLLKSHVEKYLPIYMVPSVFIEVTNFPLTSNGKLDRQALPKPLWVDEESTYEAPQNELQEVFCRIWQQVLKVSRVGINDDFFSLGGHSILAIHVLHQMSQVTQQSLVVVDLFKHRTIAKLCQALSSSDGLTDIQPYDSISAPLSYAADRLWFIEQFEQGTDAYHMPLVFELQQHIDIEALKKTIAAIVSRHDVLRTVFVQDEQGLYSQELTMRPWVLDEQVVTEASFENLRYELLHRPFDLTIDAPMRAGLFFINDSTTRYLVLVFHHVAFDAWSKDIFLKELRHVYQAFHEGGMPSLPPLSIQYRDFAIWQREMVESHLDTLLSYWYSRLLDHEPLVMPFDYPRQSIMDYQGDVVSFELSEPVLKDLEQLAHTHQVTLFTLMLGGFALLLSKYSGQSDIVLGTPVANRQHPQLMHLIGLFVNSLVLRINVEPMVDLGAYLKAIQHHLIEAQLHQDLPFEKLVNHLDIVRDTSKHPLFQIMFTLHHEARETLDVDDGPLKQVVLDKNQQAAKLDLAVSIQVSKKEARVSIQFAKALFKRTTVERLAAHYAHLLSEMLNVGERPISAIQMLSAEEFQQLVCDWNRTKTDYPRHKTIHELFKEQVLRTPDKLALIDEGQTFSYRELDEASHRLARFIERQYKGGCPPDTLIGICLFCSREMVIALFGILKVGAAYIPIDPDYPEARIAQIIEDSGCKLVLSLQSLSHLFTTSQVLCLDENVYQHEPLAALQSTTLATDLAYVLYTSGTTGQPKGVMIEHRSVVALLYSRLCRGIDADAKGTLWTNITFDVSVYEMFSILLQGGELHLLSDRVRLDAQVLFQYLLTHHISSLYLPPFFVEAISKALQSYDGLIPIKKLLLGVEPIPYRHLTGFLAKNIAITNAYGPTEATVSSTAYAVDRHEHELTDILPIGRALENEVAYVLDKHLSPVPIGVIGELYLGGDGLARGYLNQPLLTASFFIENPFESLDGYSRLYKTGDKVRWTSEGQLEYIGRVDFQVKRHGVRIELRDIEYALMSHPLLEKCVVVVNDGRLEAYYIGKELSSEDLMTHCCARLPDYMLPDVFIHLDAFPLTSNGKLNREALFCLKVPEDTPHYVGPRHDLDAKVCCIWQEILKVTQVGIIDDFFRLGGDSIASLQVISRLRYANLYCSVKEIFQYRTIERLVDHVLSQKSFQTVVAESGILMGTFGLLPIQRWFFDQNFANPEHWNQAFLVRVPTLSVERLNTILPEFINHHDMLRARFIKLDDHHYEQCYLPSIPNVILERFTWPYQFEQSDLLNVLNKWQSGFDLAEGPTWRLAYIDGLRDGSARLFFVAHHLLIDTVSWRILIDDLKRLYHGNALGAKTSSYRQWVQRVATYQQEHQVMFDASMKQVKALTPKILKDHDHQHHQLVLNPQLTQQLMTVANEAYHTKAQDLLLTALAYALQEVLGGSTHAVTLEGHGREPIDECLDVSQTIGWFTTLYPVVLRLQGTFTETLCEIKEAIHNIPHHGIGFETKDLPAIYFNYHGQLDLVADDWCLVSEPTGVSIHESNTYDFLMLINASVVDGQLRVYFGLKLAHSEQKPLVKAFEVALTKLIHHCTQRVALQKFQYTPSDFNNVLSEADLSILPLIHDKEALYHPFEMTGIQKAYAIGRAMQFEIGNIANHLYVEFSFNRLDVPRLERALNRLIYIHPELRTVFSVDDLTARFLPYHDAMYYPINIEVFDNAYDPLLLHSIRNKLSHVVYDVSAYPMFEFCVSAFLDRKILHISFDLLLLDAQGRTKFFSELTRMYEHEEETSPGLSITFRDYQVYMGMIKSSPWYQADKAYWQKKLQQLPLRPKLPLTTDPRAVKTPHFKLCRRQISAAVFKKFKQKADDHGLSPASVLLSLYGFVLSRYAETSDFLITMTLFNRYAIHHEVNELWGDFTSTNLFGFSRKAGSALAFFKHTHEVLWDDIAHALYTGLEVQRDLTSLHELDPTSAVSPIVFTCILSDTKHRTLKAPYFIEKDEHSEERYWIGQTSQAWIDLQASEKEGVFSSGWLYVSELFPKDLVEHWNETYCGLISHLADADWHNILPNVKLLARETSLFEKANTSQKELPQRTLISSIAEYARLRGSATAVIDAKGTFDYQTLQSYGWQIAHVLRNEGVGRNQLVAILCEKGLAQIASALGIMTTGAAYLPLNVEWPIGRIEEVLLEGKVSHVLVTDALWAIIKSTSVARNYVIHRIESFSREYCEEPTFAKDLEADSLAYVIFTSGSTGKPKGVCISHKSAVNTIEALNQRYLVNQNDVVLALSDLSFDLSVYDLFGVLGAGGVVVFPTQSQAREPSHWLSLLNEHHITLWNSVPQLMQLLLDEGGALCSSLRLVLLSGDWVSKPLVEDLLTLPSKPKVVSLGGATEASIWSIWYEVTDLSLPTIPYGYPMPNQHVYVLNAFGEHCSVGVVGEIYIGGDGLLLRFWQDEEKTRLRLIEHPDLGRLYVTGDLGKWHPAGFIEFLGRKDNQIKRNGNRLELDEIAAKILNIKGVDQAMVLMQDNRLVAFLVLQSNLSKYRDGFDVQQFKIEQHGIRGDLKTSHTFKLNLDEMSYRLSKSYRQFSQDPLPSQEFLHPAAEINGFKKRDILQIGDLAMLLAPMSACLLPDKILPKFLYPSAGSAYAVRCYIHLPCGLGDILPGCYYYHPIDHALQASETRKLASDACIELCVYRKAIEPLYGQDWLRMASLEVGHMLYLLHDKNNVRIELKLEENHLFQEEYHLATCFLNEDDVAPFANVGQLKTVIMQKDERCFTSDDYTFALDDETIMMRTSETGHVLASAQAMVVFESPTKDPTGWITAGFEAQRYMLHWQQLKLAYCPLGLRLSESTSYALALGVRRSVDEGIAESSAEGPGLGDELQSILSTHLPSYMVPDTFVNLKAFPLTANGKIDMQALPRPDLTQESTSYLAPRTALEEAFCLVWQEVLGLDRVGIQDDFFRIGGDSVLCIHVASKLRKQGIDCSVLAMFEHRTIERLVVALDLSVAKDVDVTMDVGQVDISDDLLQRLHLQYQKSAQVLDVEE